MFEVFRGAQLVARFKLRRDADRFVVERGPGLSVIEPDARRGRRTPNPFRAVDTLPYAPLERDA